MKWSFTPASAFALALSLSVSSLALAEPADETLTTPPSARMPQKTKYVPSVPARDTAGNPVMETAVPTVPPQRYVPSVPERSRVERANTMVTPAEPEAPAPAVTTAPTAPTQRYVPSVPERKLTTLPEAAPVPTEVVMPEETPPPAVPAAPVMAAPKQQYVPSVQVRRPIEDPSARTLPAPSSAPVESSLKAALAKAYNFNPELKSFRSRLKAVDEQVPQAYAGWLPTAEANYSYGYNKEKLNNRQLDGTHPETKSITVTQPIFNGGETLARTSRAYNTITVARAQLTDAEQRTLLDAVTAYMDVVRTNEILKLSMNNEQVLKEQLQATRDRFKLGETTRTDVAQSEARLARAASDRVRAAGDFDVAKATYLRVIGENPPTSLKMPKNLPPLPKSLEEALRIGLGKNPNLIAADVSRDIADDDVDLAIAPILPSVFLQGQKIDQDGLSSSRGNTLQEDSLTLNASIPLFQSGAEYSRVRQNKRTRQQRREEYDATRNETVESITSRWRDIITASASIVSNKSAVESATVALDGVKQEAQVGTRTTLDVLDAEQELFVAKVNLVTAEAREVVAVYALLAASGVLTAQDLALNVEPYDPTDHARSVRYRVIGF